MKALSFAQHGTPDNLSYGEIPTPTPATGEVLIRVHACALNHLDLWVLRGWPGLKLSLPHIGGSDIAGEIVELGAEVSPTYAAGARVALTPGYLPAGAHDEWIDRGEESLSPHYRIFGENRPGGFAQFVTAPAAAVIPIPDPLPYSHAAAPMLVATTAWRMLKHRAHLRSGESVLIVGAGGGLNSFAILLAKSLGAHVFALTGTAEKAERARAAGAEEVGNYRETPDWSKLVRSWTGKRGVDVVVDNVGAATFQHSLLALARGGRLVTVGNTSGPMVQFDNRLIFGKQLSIIGSTMGTSRDAREAIAFAWANDPGQWIGSELPLSQGAEGYRMLERGDRWGKIVLVPEA